MRKYFVHTALGILLLTIVGMQLLTAPIVGLPIGISVEIKPEVLNIKENKGGVIIAFIEFRDPTHNVSDIESIELHVEGGRDSVQPHACIVADDKLIAKFKASEVAGLIRTTLGHMQPTPPKAEYHKSIVIEGIVIEATEEKHFKGSHQIMVILP